MQKLEDFGWATEVVAPKASEPRSVWERLTGGKGRKNDVQGRRDDDDDDDDMPGPNAGATLWPTAMSRPKTAAFA